MLREGLQPDAAFYTTLFTGLVAAGRKEEAAEVLNTMKRKACSFTTATYNAVITGLCRENDFLAALKLLNEMEAQGIKPDVISSNVIIGGLCRGGKWREAKEIFTHMARRGCQPDVISYRTMFDGLCDASRCKEAALVLEEMSLKGYSPRPTGLNKLVAELGRKADAELLWSVWNTVERRNVAVDVETWERMVYEISDKDQVADAAFVMDALLLP
uniref:Pentatricopeptide repeat-containing protein n=1 Tax=Kalanchoe fedtschenkoi TaxID=63787 RepID=A0A7N0VFC6_KALFE